MTTGDSASASAGSCLIAGCGYTGARLARRLAARGPVLALVRSQAHADPEDGVRASLREMGSGNSWTSV